MFEEKLQRANVREKKNNQIQLKNGRNCNGVRGINTITK